MQTRRSAKQWGKVFKRGVVLLCVLLLFFCVGIVFLLTVTTYAHGSNAVRPADMSPTTIPTTLPTTIPTLVPTTVPTVVPTTAPTSVPTVAPTTQPKPPRTNPTPPPPVPTATAIGGGLPPPINTNNPTPQPTMGGTTSPTPTVHKTATAIASSPTAAATTTVSSVIPGANTTSTPSQQGTNSVISLPQIALIGGGGVFLAGVLFVGLVWRQRRMQLRSGQPGFAQRSGLYPLQGKAVTEPLYQAPQPLMQQAVPEMALAASTPPIQYAQAAAMPQTLLREQEPVYQEASPVPMEMMRVAETSSQAPDSLLESMMRQAQMGLFALPNKME